MKKRLNLHKDTMIDVVLRKKMTVEQYLKNMQAYKSKGWQIQGYQDEFLK